MYKKYNHTVGYNIWKLEWCTKYRYRIFAKFFMMIYCKVAVAEACKRHEIEILALKVMPEHVHMIASLPRGIYCWRDRIRRSNRLCEQPRSSSCILGSHGL